MIRRVPPPRYQSSEGRLVDYVAQFEATVALPTNLWSFKLQKTYIPWDTWDAFMEGGAPRMPSTPPNYPSGTFALKTLPKEHERTLEDVTARILRETDVVDKEGWTFDAYQRHFRFLAPAAIDALNDILPWLQDPAAYHWDTIKNILVDYGQTSALDYPRLSDPAYFEARRQDAVNLWQMVDCVSQTLAAKWELAFGECYGDPNPDDFRLPNLDEAVEVSGWMLNHFPSLREGEIPLSFDRFVDLHRVQMQPQEFAPNVQELADRFGSAAMPDLLGQVWSDRYGYDALLADLEQSLASPDQLIGLGWLYPERAMR